MSKVENQVVSRQETGVPYTCGLCGHVIVARNCGFAAVGTADGGQVVLCHADDHDCYHRWTVYNARPVDKINDGDISSEEIR